MLVLKHAVLLHGVVEAAEDAAEEVEELLGQRPLQLGLRLQRAEEDRAGRNLRAEEGISGFAGGDAVEDVLWDECVEEDSVLLRREVSLFRHGELLPSQELAILAGKCGCQSSTRLKKQCAEENPSSGTDGQNSDDKN